MVSHTMLTAEQCAERLGVSRSLIYAALQAGKLVGYRIGCRGKGCWRVSEYDLMQWLQTLRVSETVPDPPPPPVRRVPPPAGGFKHLKL